jgi:predicted nucleotidyltransferase
MPLANNELNAFKEVLDALEEAFGALGINFFVIGALAKQVWFKKERKKFRQTKDADFAVFVSSQQEYYQLMSYLVDKRQFQESKENAFKLIAPDGTEVDILPFGEIADNGELKMPGVRFSNIKIDGFQEVYNAGLSTEKMETGHNFQVATLPSIVLLKLIAYDDRPELRAKDARDIALILQHAFELMSEAIYASHLDLFDSLQENLTVEQIGVIVIGREIFMLIQHNPDLLERLNRILQAHILAAEKGAFVKQMAAETRIDTDTLTGYLQLIKGQLQ